MTKIYNSSDSETSFLEIVNSKLKGHKINSIKDYKTFEKNLLKFKTFELEENKKEIISLNEETTYLRFKNKRITEKIKNTKKEIKIQTLNIENKYGDLKEEIQEQINKLVNQLTDLEEELEQNKEKIEENKNETKSRKTTKTKEITSNFENNKNELKKIQNNKILQNFLIKSEGENKIITEIATKFTNQENTYLINSLDLNLNIEKNQTHIQNKILNQAKIDHLFISPKGLFLFKTITWKSSTPTPAQKVITDLEKQITQYKTLIKNQYSKLINKELEILVIFTNSEIHLDKNLKIKSTKLENLEKLINTKKDKLTPDQIVEILDEISPNIKGFSLTEKISIKSQKSYSKVKNFLKEKINKISK